MLQRAEELEGVLKLVLAAPRLDAAAAAAAAAASQGVASTSGIHVETLEPNGKTKGHVTVTSTLLPALQVRVSCAAERTFTVDVLPGMCVFVYLCV